MSPRSGILRGLVWGDGGLWLPTAPGPWAGVAWAPGGGWDIGSWQRGALGRASKTLEGVLLVHSSAWGHWVRGERPSFGLATLNTGRFLVPPPLQKVGQGAIF